MDRPTKARDKFILGQSAYNLAANLVEDMMDTDLSVGGEVREDKLSLIEITHKWTRGDVYEKFRRLPVDVRALLPSTAKQYFDALRSEEKSPVIFLRIYLFEGERIGTTDVAGQFEAHLPEKLPPRIQALGVVPYNVNIEVLGVSDKKTIQEILRGPRKGAAIFGILSKINPTIREDITVTLGEELAHWLQEAVIETEWPRWPSPAKGYSVFQHMTLPDELEAKITTAAVPELLSAIVQRMRTPEQPTLLYEDFDVAVADIIRNILLNRPEIRDNIAQSIEQGEKATRTITRVAIQGVVEAIEWIVDRIIKIGDEEKKEYMDRVHKIAMDVVPRIIEEIKGRVEEIRRREEEEYLLRVYLFSVH